MGKRPFFFEDHFVKEIIDKIPAAHNVYFYCGAGVSLDRTGLSWKGLIDKLFQVFLQRNGVGSNEHRAALSYVVKNNPEKDQAPTLFEQFFEELTPDMDIGDLVKRSTDELRQKLPEMLYTKTWSEGRLLHNLLVLAIQVASEGREVALVTTNYDNYLEHKYFDILGIALKYADSEPYFPGLKVRVIVPDGDYYSVEDKTLFEPIGGASESLTIEYLHGRIPRSNSPLPASGFIVLDELSYAYTRNAVVSRLSEMFRKPHSLSLIVGSSLKDQPLVESLAVTRHFAACKSISRFAVINGVEDDKVHYDFFDPARGELFHAEISPQSIRGIHQRRGARLGVKYLYPMAHFQAAQLFEELVISNSLNKTPSCPPELVENSKYGKRLEAWWREFVELGITSEDVHVQLKNVVLLFKERLLPEGEPDYSEKSLEISKIRAELWLRINPRSDNRKLTLFSTSAGPLNAEELRRSESIHNDYAANASVRAFREGKPLLQDLKDLGVDEKSTRWKQFLSVPIILNYPVRLGSTEIVGSVRCGVITLCGLEGSNLKEVFDSLPSYRQKPGITALIMAGRLMSSRRVKSFIDM